MADLEAEVLAAAERAVKMSRDRGGTVLDYSEESIGVLEEIVSEAAEYAADMSEAALRRLAEDLGCYLLEIGRRQHGGAYFWHSREQPVLVVGEPAFHVAMISWDKLRGRLSGDK